MMPSRRISDIAERTRFVPGIDLTLGRSRRPGSPAGVLGCEEVTYVHEADNVVVRAAPRDSAMRVGRRQPQRLVDRHGRVEEVDLGARHHHLVQLAVASRQHTSAMSWRSSGAEGLVRGHDVAQLLSEICSRPALGSPPKEAHEQVGGAREQPDDGRDIQARRSSVGAQQREALRALQGQAF
jgi:hypothetical protein